MPGLDFASAMISATVFGAKLELASITIERFTNWITGARSRGLGLALRKNGFMITAGTTYTRLWPSGVDFDTISVPTFPAAPTRFSTITGCPTRSESLGARMRETTSVGPPGA